jgi:signal transduction histidine kinase
MMQGQEAGDMISDYTDHIDRSLQRIQGMRNLIMDLLDFTKIRLEKKEERIRTLDLAEIARAAIVTVQPYAIQMEVTINLEVRSQAFIEADPADMDIIFNNLVSNSVKYNKPGGSADIIIDSDGNDVVISFADKGIGISQDDIPDLFTEFVRIKSEKTRNITGSGLGLSIVKKIVQLYYGTISVESTPNVGTVFTVRLPGNTSSTA